MPKGCSYYIPFPWTKTCHSKEKQWGKKQQTVAYFYLYNQKTLVNHTITHRKEYWDANKKRIPMPSSPPYSLMCNKNEPYAPLPHVLILLYSTQFWTSRLLWRSQRRTSENKVTFTGGRRQSQGCCCHIMSGSNKKWGRFSVILQ